MLENSQLNQQDIIAQLNTIADSLFAAGDNYTGNRVQEIVYTLELRAETE